jgi:hypothetical protein
LDLNKGGKSIDPKAYRSMIGLLRDLLSKWVYL